MELIIKFLLIILALFASLFMLIFVLPFIYFFVTNIITIRKIEKKVQHITIEYNTFIIHRNVAINNNISFTQPFAITVQNEKTIITTSELSQLEYLSFLKNLEFEIDNLLQNISANIASIPTVAEHIGYFKQVKEGIAKANPYN